MRMFVHSLLVLSLLATSALADIVIKQGTLSSQSRAWISEMFEVQRDFYEPLVDVPEDFTVPVWLHPNRTAYIAKEKTKTWDAENFLGHYDPVKDRVVTYQQFGLDSVLIHEVQHAFHDLLGENQYGRSFYWLNEGLSHYFENAVRIRDGSVAYVASRRDIAVLDDYFSRRAKRYSDIVHFLEFHRSDRFHNSRKEDYVVRQVSRSVVAFLMRSETRKSVLYEIIRDLYAGTALNASIKKHYTGGRAAFHSDWTTYAKRLLRKK
ncbi:hypothetical protein [Halovulum sp. GXIMD14793]